MLNDLGQVGRWLSAEGLGARQVSEELMAAFLSARRDAGQRRVPGMRAMAPLLGYLREVEVAPAARPSLTPLGSLLGQYRSWLVGNVAWPPRRCGATRTAHAASCRNRCRPLGFSSPLR
jgi:hypothetical protein